MKNVNLISKLLLSILLISSTFAQSGRDVSETEVNAVAFRAENDPHTTVEFFVNVISPDFNFADGVRFTFGESVNILNAYVATEMETPAAIIISGNEVLFGEPSDGVFNGDGIFINDNEYIFVVHIDASAQAPIEIAYTVYDDGWAQDFCINEDNCDLCNDQGFGINCDGDVLSVAMNAEGVVTINDIEIVAAASQDPVIMDLVDVGNDQGKQMILSWHPGDLIDLPYFTEFSVYRYSPHSSDLGVVESGAFYGEYYSSPGSGTSPDFGELILTREDSLININFDQNPLPVNDDFQVRWTGDVHAPSAGVYNFRTHSDDGVRLFIDGTLVIDQWYDFPPTSHYGSIELDAGQHSLVLEYYENAGGAECNLYWTPPGSEESLVPPVATGIQVSDMGTWDYLVTVPWHGHDPYATLVNTLHDKVTTAFRVTAHTEDPNLFFHSDPVLGRSYDNIAPPSPSGLVATVSDTVVSLIWNPSNAEDFNYYSVHRAADSLFQPNLSNFIAYSATPMFSDHSAPWNVPLFYKVSATDIGGNLGPGSGSASVFIFVNRAPQVFDVAISPAVPLVGDDITVSYAFFDPDGDTESGTMFEWYNNGVLVPQHTGSTLPAAFTQCTDDWHVVVIPSDGSLSGEPIGSNNVIVCGANTPPVWNDSIEHIHIAEDTYDNIFEMGNLVLDAEQATSQLIFSVAGNTNETALGASFDGSKLVLSATSDDYNSSPAATLTLRVNDGNEIADTYVDVSIDSVNDNPAITEYVGRNDFDEDESYLFEIYDFVIEDPDNDALDMVMSVLPGENYAPSSDTPGLISTPPNFNGDITVNVEVVDGSGGSNVTMVPMTVNPVNDPSFMITTGLNIINNGPATEEQEYSLTISWKDPDGTEDASVYDVVLGGPAANWLSVTNVYSSGSGPDLQYNAIVAGTPDDINMTENDISFSVVDNSEGQAETFIEYFYISTISVNDAPVVENYTGPMALEEDGSLTLSPDKFAVSDIDNSPIDFMVTVSAGENYTVGSDSVTIYPSANYNGDLSVSVSISDGDKSDDITISLTVVPVNDALVLADVADGSATEESPFSSAISWTDIDGTGADAYSVTLDGEADAWLDASDVTYDSDSGVYSVSVSGTPDDENLYQNDLSVTVTDNSEGSPLSLSTYFSVAVAPVNDAPSVTNYMGGAQVNEDESFTVSINDFVVEDVDNDFPFDFDFFIVAGDNYAVSSDNRSITPTENFNGTLSVNFMISDGSVDVPFVLPVEVLPVNDDPVLAAYVGGGTVDEDNSLAFSGSDFTVTDPDDGDTEFFVSIIDSANYSVSASGSILSPDPNYHGTITVFASVNDASGGESNTISFSVTVNPVNDAPVALDLAVSPAVPEFSDFLTVSYSFSDIDGDSESGTIIEWYKDGVLQTSETSSEVSFNSTACDEVWYAVVTPNDGTEAGTSYSSNSVTICGANTSPEWTWSGPIRLYEDSVEVVDLYDNMVDAEHAPSQITYTILAQANPELVTATIDGHELHLATVIADYTQAYADTLTLEADDGGYQDTSDVVISIAPINDAPVAVDDSYSIDEGGVVIGDNDEGFLVNDVDVDGDALQIVIVDQPVNGVVQVNTDWSFSYTHDGSETTSDAFTYKAYDSEYYSNVATVSITVSPVNDSPVIVYAATFETLEDTPFDVVIGDFIIDDPDSDIGSISLQISDGTNYTSTAITDGYTITPAANYSGELIVPVSVSDGDSSSAVWELSVAVIGGNDVPTVVNAVSDISVDEDADGISISLTGSDIAPYFFDSDGDNLSFAAHTAGSGLVAAVIDGDTLHVSFIENAFGSDSLFVSATDVSGEYVVDTILVSVASVNDAPVILASAYFVTEEEDSVHVSINDFVYYDIDTDSAGLSLVLSDGDGYSIDAIATGYAVTPDPDVSDTLYVPSVISDGDTTSAVWELMVIVQPDNDAPVVVNPAADIMVNEDAGDVVIALMGTDTAPYFADSDGDSLDFSVYVVGSGVANVVVNVDSLHISFTENMYGADSLFITATDPSGDFAEDTIVVTVSSVNDAPRIVDAVSFQTNEDDSLDIYIFDFVIRDEDSPEDDITITISDNENYDLTAIEYGFRAIPAPDFSGDIPMAVTASDGQAVSDTFFTVLSVMPVNDIPEIVNPLADISVDEDADTMMISLTGTETAPYFVDVDGDSIEFDVQVSGSDIFHVMVDGYDMEISFMENMNGSDSVYVSGTDGSGAFVVDTIVVTVLSVNDVPTAFSLISPEDSAEVIITAASVLQNVTIDVAWSPSSDADGDTVGYGFVLFSGPYSVSTPALYTVDVPITALSIPHSAAAALLAAAGYQSITCDWMVFATDGQDTTASTEIRTITIDARPVLSTDELAIPEVFALHQNYPNPFNPTTTIKYDLPEAENVQIIVYDIMGRKVRTLVNEYQDIGYRTIRWDATDNYGRTVSAGMYVYTIQAGAFRQVKKMVLLK